MFPTTFCLFTGIGQAAVIGIAVAVPAVILIIIVVVICVLYVLSRKTGARPAKRSRGGASLTHVYILHKMNCMYMYMYMCLVPTRDGVLGRSFRHFGE